MAVTQKKPEEQYQPQQTQYPQQGYQGLAGVSANTAKQMQQSQQGYQPSQNVQNAQQQMQQVQAMKPQSYNSKYAPQLDSILQQIQNPQEFKYSFDGDELFKYYADLYSQNGRQASMDAMGQAAKLTGGYGNSYAQQVGNQAYDEWMRNLYDKGMDLYDRAYQRFRDDRGDLMDQYGLLTDAEQREYGRYRDTVGDWENERNYWTGRYDTEGQIDYQRFADQRDYWTGLAQVENADYRSEQERQEAIRQYDQNYARSVLESDRAYDEDVRRYDQDYARNVLESDRAFEEGVRQFNESLDWDKMSAQQKYAAEYALMILQNGQMPSEELLQQAGLSAADAAKLMAVIQTGGGGGPRKKEEELTPQEKADAKWQQFLNDYWAQDAEVRNALTAAAEEENRKKAAQNNKKTGNMTGVKKINYTTKTTK